MSAESLNALRETLTWHYGTQDPAVTIECARDAIIKLLASERGLKAEIAAMRDRLATAEAELSAARAAGAEAMREAAINMVAGWPSYVGYTGDIRTSVESRIVDRDADIISAIRQFAA